MSFVELGGAGWVLHPATDSASGWTVDIGGGRASDLDSWLTAQGVMPTTERLPVLAYGSNASPGKIEWLRSDLGLTGYVVAIQAEIEGAAAVWTGGVPPATASDLQSSPQHRGPRHIRSGWPHPSNAPCSTTAKAAANATA